MRSQLISPLLEYKTGYPQIYRFPNTGLALLAALTPPEIEMSIIDEMYDTVDFNQKLDLVGIAVTSKTVARAYQMADQFRSRDISVVLGGIHPTILPNEAIEHADAVVIGEAEDVWGKVLNDFNNGRLSHFYRADQFHSLKNLPIARRELFKSDRYDFVNLVQTSRGCPYACHFCSISKIYGKGVRLRPVDEIIEESADFGPEWGFSPHGSGGIRPSPRRFARRRVRVTICSVNEMDTAAIATVR